MNLKQHPLSAAYPAMQESEYQALLDSILEIGVQNPITLFEGQIIDGWHRYKAANECGMACPSVELGEVDPRDFAKSQGARRNITASQNALAITTIYAWRPHGDQRSAVTADRVKTTKELAAIAGVGTRTIEQAKAVQAGGVKAVQDAVKTGSVSVETAAAVAKLPAKEQNKIAAKGPEAMRAAAKPDAFEPEADALPEYTELDAAHDQIGDLQAALAVATMGEVSEDDKAQAAVLISELRNRIKTLELTLKAVTTSRDTYMSENAELRKQITRQRREIDKATGHKTA